MLRYLLLVVLLAGCGTTQSTTFSTIGSELTAPPEASASPSPSADAAAVDETTAIVRAGVSRAGRQLAAISAIVVGVGSLVASVTPTALGALRDLFGDFSVSSWLLAGLSAFLVFSSALVDTRAQSSPSQEGKEISLPT